MNQNIAFIDHFQAIDNIGKLLSTTIRQFGTKNFIAHELSNSEQLNLLDSEFLNAGVKNKKLSFLHICHNIFFFVIKKENMRWYSL